MSQDRKPIESPSQLGGIRPGRSELEVGIAYLVHPLVREDPHGDRVGRPGGRAPEDPLAGDWLVEDAAEDVVAEVGVGLAEVDQVAGREEMKDEPVIPLAQDLVRDAAGL